MYSTQNNLVFVKPVVKYNDVVGKYLLFPDKTSQRKGEGGLRLMGRYKRSFDSKPLISVVTTVHNRSSVIEKAICSVLAQTYDNIEYIIVDGASTDSTLDVIRKYDDVIDYFVSEPDSSLYEGMNKGLQLSQGDYIIILNSDDWYIPDCVDRLVQATVSGDLELVCALATETDIEGNVIRNIPMMPFRANVRLRMPLRHETMLVSRKLYNKVGLYDDSYKIIGDLKLTQKMYDHVKSFRQLNDYLMFFRKIGVASELTEQFINERIRLLKEQFVFLSFQEVNLLANEFSGDISPYVTLVQKYADHEKFVEAIYEFLALHNKGVEK